MARKLQQQESPPRNNLQSLIANLPLGVTIALFAYVVNISSERGKTLATIEEHAREIRVVEESVRVGQEKQNHMAEDLAAIRATLESAVAATGQHKAQ